jgi:hypothetical protein
MTIKHFLHHLFTFLRRLAAKKFRKGADEKQSLRGNLLFLFVRREASTRVRSICDTNYMNLEFFFTTDPIHFEESENVCDAVAKLCSVHIETSDC